MDKNPVGQIDGKSGKEEILDVLSKHGVTTDEKGVSVTIWGTGTPLREFMYSRDMAAACVYIMENADVDDIVDLQKKQNPNLEHYTHFVNIGSGEELSIGQLAEMIAKFVGFKGNIIFDSSKPDGTMRKVTDISILRNLGFKAEHTLETGLKEMYDYYLGKIKD
ncbi:MAG: NAD-dependent epimerase/dehydratase family protein [Bacteroidales bacterium]|nr:NAD-dependent epimerase/dehydratase family protein [Bacteroidales bacterium]